MRVVLAANGCLRENDEPHFCQLTFDCCMEDVLEGDKYGSNETNQEVMGSDSGLYYFCHTGRG